MRIEIFRAAIFILSASPSDLDSAAVAAKISIPVKEKIALIQPVLRTLTFVQIKKYLEPTIPPETFRRNL